MASTQERVATTRGVSCWQVFRLIFVVFSLYLMGDAFSRWDGFRYYASFSEFLPSVALVTILWSIVVVFSAIVVWLLGRVLEWFCMRIGWELKIEHFLLFMCVFILLGTIALVGKRFILYGQVTPQLKLAVFLCVTITAVFVIWLYHDKSKRLMDIIQERITPLLWLFGVWFVISFPLVIYHTWVKWPDNTVVSQKISQASVSDKNQPNIILVTFDALTARNMSVYGYHRPTTKFITTWAKEASLFTRVEAESNITTPTTASIMTGKRLWTHQTYHNDGSKPIKSNIENLALMLKNDGYYNMAFIVNPNTSVKTLGIANSFDIALITTEFTISAFLIGWDFGIIDKLLYRLFGDKIRLYNWIIRGDFILGRLLRRISKNLSEISKTVVPPEKAFNRFLAVIDDNPSEPFFVWIHLLPPHYPYLPPEPYMGMFDSSQRLRMYKSQANEFRKKFIRNYYTLDMLPTVDTLRARYDEFIRYCDKQFEDFIAKLTIMNKLDNTIVILSSDHGESFEHNYLRHSGRHLYEQMTHIPLIIKEPGQSKGWFIDDLAEQIDIPPTILEIAKIPVPSWMEGRSLVPLMRGKKLPPRPAFSMALQKNPSRGHRITRGTIAVWEGDYKLIHYLEEDKSLLFNLKEDPDELENLFDREPVIGQRLLTLIQDNLEKANERIGRGE